MDPVHRPRPTSPDGRPLALRRLLALGSMALALHGVAAGPLFAQATVTDPQSGVAFPSQLTPPGGGPPHQLTGTATRERTIFKVKVYAYGLYVDPASARTQLGQFAGRPASALERDHTFLQRLLDIRMAMSLRLVTTRDLAGDAMRNAFDEALKPRVERAAETLEMPDGGLALERFRGYFNLREMAAGTEIVFSCSPGGRLTATVGGERKPPIESPALCWALFDVYLGDRPISADGRRRLVAGFPELLAGSP